VKKDEYDPLLPVPREAEESLDPLVEALFAEANAADSRDPDMTAIAEHVVARAFGQPSSRDALIRAARVEATLRRRPYLRRRGESMQRRLERLVERMADPVGEFARLTGPQAG